MPVDPTALANVGQRRHGRPAAAVAADVPRDPRGQPGLVGGVRVVVRAVRQRRHRRLPRPPPRHDHRRVRSSTRSPTRCSCSGRCSRSSPATCSGSCRCAIIAAREFIISVYRTVVELEGRQRAGQQAGASGRRSCQQFAVGFALLAVVRRRREVVVELAAVDRRRARRCVSGAQYLWHARTQRPTEPRRTGDAGAADALRRPRGRHRAAARPDRRHQLVVDRRAAGGAAASTRCCRSRSATTSARIDDAAAARCSPTPTR